MQKKRYEYAPLMSKERIQELQHMIGDNWYLSLDTLAERLNICVDTLHKLMIGYSVGPLTEERIVNFFKYYKGEK